MGTVPKSHLKTLSFYKRLYLTATSSICYTLCGNKIRNERVNPLQDGGTKPRVLNQEIGRIAGLPNTEESVFDNPVFI